ncbi:hypothetical protein Glove_642g15 [Diversispora epigaea]|uniref:HMG box domain-containing protein n=1 Tax=Diversispora epigaea TaxID=1348612 RepID=A0A397GCT8_9GLOM|nr:hypothetical protein Glove_642g15 [Diversispora epigaea]
MPNFEIYELNEIKIPDSDGIKQHTFLRLEDLIAPRPRKGRSHKVPRPQNPFVIYRQNIQAKITKDLGLQYGSQLDYVSKVASISWKNASAEVKTVFNDLAISAKQFHGISYPEYRYQPKKKPKKYIDNRILSIHIPPLNATTISYSTTSTLNNQPIYDLNYNFPTTSTRLILPPLEKKPKKYIDNRILSIHIPPLNATTISYSTTSTLNNQPIYDLNYNFPTTSTRLILPPLEVNISQYSTYVYDRNLLASLTTKGII